MSENIDARIAVKKVKSFFQEQSGPLGTIYFKIISVKPNDKEGIYYVKCSFYQNPTATKPSTYETKVNIKTGQIIRAEEIKDESIWAYGEQYFFPQKIVFYK